MIDVIRSPDTRMRILDYIGYGKDKNEQFIKQDIPDILYKYRSLNKWTLEGLEKGHVYASTPIDFNDIFDSRENNNYMNSYIFKRKNINNLITINLADLGFLNLKNEEFLGHCAENTIHRFDYMSKILRIVCFSETNQSTLMWSHYSENHTGICIGYNLKSDNENKEFYTHIYPVNYIKEPIETLELKNPDYKNYNNEHEIDILISTITKSQEWSYEKEWRFIIGYAGLDKDRDGIEILMPKPKEIILGSKFFEILNYFEGKRLAERLELTKRLMKYSLDNNVSLNILLPRIGTYSLFKEKININELNDILLGYDSILNLNSYIEELQIQNYIKTIGNKS